MPGWMNAGRSYVPPVGIGGGARAGAVGEVLASRHPGFEVGQHVVGMFGVQECAVSDGRGMLTVDPALAPLPTYLGTLGMPGMTAYFGLLRYPLRRLGHWTRTGSVGRRRTAPSPLGRSPSTRDDFLGLGPALAALSDRSDDPSPASVGPAFAPPTATAGGIGGTASAGKNVVVTTAPRADRRARPVRKDS